MTTTDRVANFQHFGFFREIVSQSATRIANAEMTPRALMNTAKQLAQHLAAATMLLASIGPPPTWAQTTMEDAEAAYSRGDYVTALSGFQVYAEQGRTRAQFMLGRMYNRGTGVAQNDAEAVRWFRRAAEQGHVGAQSNLGVMYAWGVGVAENDVEAVRWFRLAAEQGNASAQSNLGFMYIRGEGVRQDYAEAMRWFRRAAEQGDADAQFNLGLMYARGEGIRENAVNAYAWFSVAAAQGATNAQNAKEFAADNMSQAQIAEAEKLSRIFRTRYVIPFQ